MRGVGTMHNSFERMIQQKKNEHEIPPVLGHSGPIYPLPIFYILENLGTRLFEGQTNSPHLTHLFPPQYKNSDLPRNHEPESREMVKGGWLFMFHFFRYKFLF